MDFERRNYSELPQPSGAFHHSVRSETRGTETKLSLITPPPTYRR